MQWDDSSFFGGGGLGSIQPDAPTDDFSNTAGWDPSFGTTSAGSYDYAGGLPAFSAQLQDPTAGYGGAAQSGSPMGSQTGTPMGLGSQSPLFSGLPGMGGLNSLQGLLGIGGGLAGLGGLLAGGGVTGTQRPTLPPNAMAQLNQGVGALGPAAQGALPLQQLQAQLLQSLAMGQIPPQMAALVQSAYSPAYQNAATQSIDAARKAGFFDNPLSSPVGGAIMGPAAAQLQGQQANSLLGLMQSFPQLFNQPIGNQISAAGQQGNQLLSGAGLQTGQKQSQPLGSQIGQAIGGGLSGMSQAIGQNQQNQMLGQILQRQLGGQGGIPNTGNYA